MLNNRHKKVLDKMEQALEMYSHHNCNGNLKYCNTKKEHTLPSKYAEKLVFFLNRTGELESISLSLGNKGLLPQTQYMHWASHGGVCELITHPCFLHLFKLDYFNSIHKYFFFKNLETYKMQQPSL